ncbi:LysE family translocator [Peribacillus alkalitolerans]|uniref:LysE family translocator n=1 Tax=Peribacillus alkalitolerans TaxID=1550385 RepID=UPI0013D62B38|nr:LysE family translocator [Peribacillus alkalitolerans]
METYVLFIFTSICLLLIPGPDMALALANTISYGKKGGAKTILGICSAILMHLFIAIIGLSSLLEKSLVLFNIIKFSGAIYLIYIGVKSIASIRTKSKDDDWRDLSKHNQEHCFRQGFMSNLLNPKVVLFFLSFLPQFIDTNSNHMNQFLLLGLTHLLLTIIYFTVFIGLIHKYSNFMDPSAIRLINSLTGILLIVFGLKLAFFRV